MHYSDAERLTMLRAVDNWRQWSSVEDERLCIECAQLITGREITLAEEEDGKPVAYCPTPGCKSTPRDWFYHGTREQHARTNTAATA